MMIRYGEAEPGPEPALELSNRDRRISFALLAGG